MYISETDQFRRVLKKHGLSDDNIAGILEGENGKLWLSTKGGGLVAFDKENWLISGKPINECMDIYDASDGLQGNEFAYNAAVKGNKGFLYFAGINGLSYFHPDSIIENEKPPNVIISQLKLFNKEVIPGDESGILDRHISVSRHLELKPNQDVLTFVFTAFNYEQPEKNTYAYKLEGFDKDWYEIGTKREATYTNLPPGEYILHVKAANNDGYWNHEGQQLKITILPPWWKTLWFRISLVSLIVVLTYLIAFLRTRSIKQQKKLLEELVHEKTLELEKQNIEVQEMAEKVHAADQSKIRFFMNISHEFRTPLSLILGPVNQLVNTGGMQQDVHEKHLFIQRNAHRLLRLINQLLDLRKIEVKEIQISVSHENLKGFVTSIGESFVYMAESKGIRYSIEVDDHFDNDKAYFDRDIIEKSIYNLLSNAFKNVSSGDEVRLQLSSVNENKEALIKVVDTGVGISPDKIDKIFDRFYSYSSNGRHKESTGIGLTLIKELIQMHKGSIEVESEPGNGATFSIKVPVTREAYKEEELVQNQSVIKKSEWSILHIEGKSHQLLKDEDLHNILLIEDNKDLTEYIKMELSPYYNIDVAKNGKSGIDKLNKKSYQLVISDVMMPVMDGIEFTKHIRSDENWSHLPIILLTAKQGEDIRIESYEIGADAYISKPFDMQVLKARIDNLIHSRSQLIEQFTRDTHLLPEISPNVNGDEAFLNKIIHIIEDHISDPQLGYKVFIEEMGMSKTKLYSKLGKLTGQSINIFIRTTRLKVAARLLKQTDLSVSEVSYKVGFTDPNYFSKCFKTQFSMAPSEFKEQGVDVDH
jgi:signal transduction histidine kinase/CheY-like chemotaxis protein/AraC-like DNA-binding protein